MELLPRPFKDGGRFRKCSFIRGSRRIVKSSLLQNKLSLFSVILWVNLWSICCVARIGPHIVYIDLFILLTAAVLNQ